MASYCAGCGTSLSGGARFCSTCGKGVIELGPVGPRPFAPLLRPVAGRKMGGVCQGLANQYGWDVTWTRVIAVLLAVVTFPIGLLIYFLMWLLVPEESRSLPQTTTLDTTT